MSTSGSVDRDRVVEAYYADVRNSNLLSADRERELFRQYRTCTNCQYGFQEDATCVQCPRCGTRRNMRARELIIEGALRFVIKVAKVYARKAKGVNYDPDLLLQLISAGNLGLLDTVDRFETERGTRFLTYAAWWIREKICAELDSMGLVRVPTYKQKALRAKRKMNDGSDVEPPHVTLEEVSEIDSKHRDERLERDLLNTYGSDLVQQALIDLGFRGRDKYIVLAYFGMRDEPKNLRQISNRLDLSSERVRQIKKDCLDQLKSYLEAKRVRLTDDLFTE